MANIPLFTGLHTCWVVVWDFWTINSMFTQGYRPGSPGFYHNNDFQWIFQHTSGTYSRPPINSLCRKFLNNLCVCVPLEMPAVCSTWRIMPVSKYFQSQIYNPIKGPWDVPGLDEEQGLFDHFQKYVGSTLHPGCNRSWQKRLLLGAHFFSFGKGPTTRSLRHLRSPWKKNNWTIHWNVPPSRGFPGGFNPSAKYFSQFGSFPQIGINIKHAWNHHPVINLRIQKDYPPGDLIIFDSCPFYHLVRGQQKPVGLCWGFLRHSGFHRGITDTSPQMSSHHWHQHLATISLWANAGDLVKESSTKCPTNKALGIILVCPNCVSFFCGMGWSSTSTFNTQMLRMGLEYLPIIYREFKANVGTVQFCWWSFLGWWISVTLSQRLNWWPPTRG